MNADPARGPTRADRGAERHPAPELSALFTAVRQGCAARGLDPTGMRLLHRYNNAVILLPSEHAVARVATRRHNAAQIKQIQHVTTWLAEEHSFPATRPLAGADPVELEPATTISFWTYYPQPPQPTPLTSARPAALDTLESLDHALHDDTTAQALDDTDRYWLLQRLHQIRDDLATLDWPLGQGLIHGDAWAGNLLWAPAPPVKRTTSSSATGTGSPTALAKPTSSPPGTPPADTAKAPPGHTTSPAATATTSPAGPASPPCSPCATSPKSPVPSAAHHTHHPTPTPYNNASTHSEQSTPPPPGQPSNPTQPGDPQPAYSGRRVVRIRLVVGTNNWGTRFTNGVIAVIARLIVGWDTL
ncbi:MAG TPA: hypothetical protein VFO16_13180 [Pseudonocardiaceae bacterium]|nr:hypothetical protein [Pseudonocardiaceae bacterium]